MAAPECFVGASRGQNAILREQISKKFAENGLFWPFFLPGGGQVGGSRTSGCGGEWPYAPSMPPLMISSLRYKCPPPRSQSWYNYDYREKTWKIVSTGPSIEFPVSVFSTFNWRDLNFKDPWFKKGSLKFSTLVWGGAWQKNYHKSSSEKFSSHAFLCGWSVIFMAKEGPIFFIFFLPQIF